MIGIAANRARRRLELDDQRKADDGFVGDQWLAIPHGFRTEIIENRTDLG
jgi:hypothetical protein